MPMLSMEGSTWGAFLSYTLDGPPERIIAGTFFLFSSSAVMVCGKISEYTFCSLIGRALSCVYLDPKSRTATVCLFILINL